MKKVFIIIVTYNGMRWIKQCLDSCKGFEVIIVDNASTDGTQDFVISNYPKFHLICQDHNLGFGQANNLGIKYALERAADYVFLLNQDAYILNDCIEKLVETSIAKTEYGILSPIHLNGSGDKLDKGFSHYLEYDKNPEFYSDTVLNHRMKSVYQIPFVNAAAWLVSRSCIEKVGLFDPIFYHYGEDINYCQRLNYYGFKTGVVPHTYVKHDRFSSKISHDKRFSDTYFKNIERQYKIQWANINKNQTLIDKSIAKWLDRNKSEIYKSIMLFNFNRLKNLRKERHLISKIIAEIQESRRRNIN